MVHAIPGCKTVSAWEVWKVFPELTPSLRALAVSPEDISEENMESLRSCESSLWQNKQPQKRQLKARAVLNKKTRSLASIPPTRAALVNHAKMVMFQDGFVWPQTRPEGASATISGGWQLAGSVWVTHWTNLQEVNNTCYEVIHCCCVKRSVEDVVSVLKEIWHAHICANVGGQLQLGPAL